MRVGISKSVGSKRALIDEMVKWGPRKGITRLIGAGTEALVTVLQSYASGFYPVSSM